MPNHPNCTDDEFEALVKYIRAAADLVTESDGHGIYFVPDDAVLPPFSPVVVTSDCATIYDGIKWQDLADAGVSSEELELCVMAHGQRLDLRAYPDGDRCAIGAFMAWMNRHVNWFRDRESGIGLLRLGHPWDRPEVHPEHPQHPEYLDPQS